MVKLYGQWDFFLKEVGNLLHQDNESVITHLVFSLEKVFCCVFSLFSQGLVNFPPLCLSLSLSLALLK